MQEYFTSWGIPPEVFNYLIMPFLIFCARVMDVSINTLRIMFVMNGKKKISDFLIDKKVPANLKTKTLVLVSDQSIAWIAGQRLDNRFKVTDKTERVVEISVQAKP